MNLPRTRRGPLIGLVAAVGMLLMLAMPVAAATVVPLHGPHQGIDSSDAASFEEADCGPFGNVGTGVVWHFILNGLDSGTPAAEASFDFTTAGTVNVTASNDGQTQHIWVLTTGDDILENGSATVADQTGTPNLVLSHICHQAAPPPTPTPTPTATPTATPGGGVAGGNPTPTQAPVPNPAMLPQGAFPAVLLSLLLIGSLGTMAYVRVTSRR